jgi:hypothetical protein
MKDNSLHRKPRKPGETSCTGQEIQFETSENECICIRAFVRRPANLYVAGNFSHYILTITWFGTPTSNYLTNFLNGFWKTSNRIKIKVCLSAVNTTIDYKTDIKILIFDYFVYIALHVSICKDHHQVVYECISVVTELTTKMDFSYIY